MCTAIAQQSFNSARSTFAEFDREHKGYIVYSDVVAAFERLGVAFTQEEARQVFQESDMLENGQLTFKEFLVCLAIGFVLHVRVWSECSRRWWSLTSVCAPSGSRRSRASASASSTPPCTLVYLPSDDELCELTDDAILRSREGGADSQAASAPAILFGEVRALCCSEKSMRALPSNYGLVRSR